MDTRGAWDDFLATVYGEQPGHVPVALGADSHFLPGLFKLNVLDYMLYPDKWLRANLALEQRFPDVTWLPGFWVEFGAATEASAFGASVMWRHDQTPSVQPLDLPPGRWGDVRRPDPYTDGLMALVVHRYWNLEKEGELPDPYRVRFVAARGPFTLATHVLGAAQFMNAINDAPQAAEAALEIFTETTIRFLNAQLSCLRQPEGIILLDDTVGMLPVSVFQTLGLRYLGRIFKAFQGLVRIYYNHTPCSHLLPHLPTLDFDLFHFSHEMNITEVKTALAPRIALMGNISPLGQLARGTPARVEAAARECIAQANGSGFVLSAGGATRYGTPLRNIDALVRATRLD